jgi:Mg2+-importing ATPase
MKNMAAAQPDGKDKLEESVNSVPASNEEVLCLSIDDILKKFKTSLSSGLTSQAAEKALEVFGPNEVEKKKRRTALVDFFYKFRNPLIIILLVAALITAATGDITDPLIISIIILVSVTLDFVQENRAERAAEELQKRVATTAAVLRDSVRKQIPLSEVVPGDIIFLTSGDIVPADARIVASKDLYIDQSALTGESFPAEKTSMPIEPQCVSSVTEWTDYLFLGTSVVSGTCNAVVVKTGATTEYGQIAKELARRRPATEFETGLRRFGYMITQITLFLVFAVFIGRIFLLTQGLTGGQPANTFILQSLLFAAALAVGLTPELLPAILSLNLAKGAVEMSKKEVIVKRLSSIQNFGSMDVLCTDKTGTLTENKVTLVLHVDLEGKEDERVLLYSYLNSYYETGLKSPLDDSILRHQELDIKEYKKIDEVPFDFVRKRVSIVVEYQRQRFFITKGAPEEIAKVCSYYELEGLLLDVTPEIHQKIERKYIDLSNQGYRVLGVCYKKLREEKPNYTVNDENEMVFLGFVAFLDPPKESAKKSLELLKQYKIELKILTGDNELVTKKVCEEIGFEIKQIVLGSEILNMTDIQLARVVETANIFARVTPGQKDRIMTALKNNGHVVGFLGDGINDAPSMKVSDVGISVENAVDVAKESADIILLRTDLTVLAEGVLEGRKTFGNTMKYILMGMSSNFGNMFSAAGASFFLTAFLPMTATQLLLNNLLYALSQTTIPTDKVDQEYIEKPKRLDVAFIRNYMIYFGPISSIFDFLTFYIMLNIFTPGIHGTLFQTAWFVESLSTQTLVIFIIRTRISPFYKSKPSLPLLTSSLAVVAVGIIIPLTFFRHYFEFTILPPAFYIFLTAFIGAYLALAEGLKRYFYKRYSPLIEQTVIPRKAYKAAVTEQKTR